MNGEREIIRWTNQRLQTDAVMEGRISIAQAEAQKERLEKRAKDELKNSPGELSTKVSLLKAIDTIPAV